MARPRISARLKRLRAAFRKRQQAGFTLIELLVAMFIATLITLSLLTLVVQLVDVNQRDASRSETQRDMQSAMNYISQELREAVFVYDGDCLQGTANPLTTANFGTECPGIVNFIPPGLSTASAGNTSIPILAFWRTDPLPTGLIAQCTAQSSKLNLDITDANYPIAQLGPTAQFSGVPCLSGRSYTLVVYVLVDDGSTSDIWQGRARIVRYQLPQFASNATTVADTNAGYVDPLSAPNSSFQQWPFRLTTDASNVSSVSNAQSARPADNTLTGNSAVLVDYVDDGLLALTPDPKSCVDRIAFDPGPPVILTTSPYALTPRKNAPFNPTNIRSFYACVRGKTYNSGGTAEANVNQEVQLFLVGNVQGRPGYPIKTPPRPEDIIDQTFPSTTRVLTRGIVNKSPK